MVLLRTPQGNFVFSYGATELGGTIPPRADTHFRIASNTKTMTAAVIVLLAQEGKLRFDDPVSKYVQAYPMATTSRSVSSLRCGAASITTLRRRNLRKASATTRPGFGRQRNCSPSRSSVRPYSLRARNADYCSTNYALLGLIAEKVEGAPLSRVFQDRLFGPLGLKATLLPTSKSNAIP